MRAAVLLACAFAFVPDARAAGSPGRAGVTGSADVSATAATLQANELPSPRVDHHQHLLSPAGAIDLNQPKLASETLPPPLAALIAARVEHWNAPAKLEPSFTDDARVLDLDGQRYLAGAPAVATYLGTRFARPFRIVPIAFFQREGRADFSGYYSRGAGDDPAHFGRVHWEIDTSAVPWRIALESPTFPAPPRDEPIDADALVAMLDEAKIDRAVVLSVGYWFDADDGAAAMKMRAENDWTAAQVARYPRRLVAFCSFDPTTSHALAELERCRARGFAGIKLHFNASRVRLRDERTFARVARVFEAANAAQLAIVLHARTGPDYGRADAGRVLKLAARAPDVVVQVAHLWGGEGFAGDALAVYAEAFDRDERVTRKLYFDLSDAHLVAADDATRATVLARIRQIGTSHLVYGSDAAMSGHARPAGTWASMTKSLPLDAREWREIARNVAPYMPSAEARPVGE